MYGRKDEAAQNQPRGRWNCSGRRAHRTDADCQHLPQALPRSPCAGTLECDMITLQPYDMGPADPNTSDRSRTGSTSPTHDEAEVDVEQASVGTQHQIVQMPVADAQDVSHDTVSRAASHEAVQCVSPPCSATKHELEASATRAQHAGCWLQLTLKSILCPPDVGRTRGGAKHSLNIAQHDLEAGKVTESLPVIALLLDLVLSSAPP